MAKAIGVYNGNYRQRNDEADYETIHEMDERELLENKVKTYQMVVAGGIGGEDELIAAQTALESYDIEQWLGHPIESMMSEANQLRSELLG